MPLDRMDGQNAWLDIEKHGGEGVAQSKKLFMYQMHTKIYNHSNDMHLSHPMQGPGML